MVIVKIEKRYMWNIFTEIKLKVFDDGLNVSCER